MGAVNSTLERRLSINPGAELAKLLKMFAAGEMPVFSAGMGDHFRIAKEKGAKFSNHPKALGISIGGTNTKILLASTSNGEVVVHRASAAPNPPRPVHAYDFFDSALLGDPVFAGYLRDERRPVVGISVPTRVLGGIPFHETKVPTIGGLLARNQSQMTDEYDLGKSFAKYLRSRGLPEAVLFYQGDGIVAHHGAVALRDMGAGDRSALLVCGTGMATGDEEAYIQAGVARMLDVGDDELFAAEDTENYQYHYAIAGKGLFGLMARAIRARSAEPGSELASFDLEPFFRDSRATRTVSLIWRTKLGGEAAGAAREIKGLVSPGAYAELQELAGWIMARCVQSMANAAVSTVAKMGRAPSGRGHILFFEGSIANDRYAHPMLKAQIRRMIGQEDLYAPLGFVRPLQPDMDDGCRPAAPAGGSQEADMENVDLTAIGAVTMAMAENLRTS